MILFQRHRWISRAVVVALLLVAFFSFTQKGYTAMTPAADANAVLVADCDTGEVIYQRNADKSVAPASTTKIMMSTLSLSPCKTFSLATFSPFFTIFFRAYFSKA